MFLCFQAIPLTFICVTILCAVTGTVRGQAKKINVSIPRKTGKSTIVTHGTIRVKK